MKIGTKKALVAATVATLLGSLVSALPAGAAVNCDPFTAYKGLKGKTVTIFTSILEPELTTLQTAWKDFTTCTGDRKSTRLNSSHRT